VPGVAATERPPSACSAFPLDRGDFQERVAHAASGGATGHENAVPSRDHEGAVEAISRENPSLTVGARISVIFMGARRGGKIGELNDISRDFDPTEAHRAGGLSMRAGRVGAGSRQVAAMEVQKQLDIDMSPLRYQFLEEPSATGFDTSWIKRRRGQGHGMFTIVFKDGIAASPMEQDRRPVRHQHHKRKRLKFFEREPVDSSTHFSQGTTPHHVHQ